MQNGSLSWRPSPRGPINGVWPKLKVGHPIWLNRLHRPGFDTDFPGEMARERFLRRYHRRSKQTYFALRREVMRNHLDFWRSGMWKRWVVRRNAGVIAAKCRESRNGMA